MLTFLMKEKTFQKVLKEYTIVCLQKSYLEKIILDHLNLSHVNTDVRRFKKSENGIKKN